MNTGEKKIDSNYYKSDLVTAPIIFTLMSLQKPLKLALGPQKNWLHWLSYTMLANVWKLLLLERT